MPDFLQGLFDWFVRVGGVLLEGVFDAVRRFKWFFVALVAALLAPIKWLLELVRDFALALAETSADLVTYMQNLGIAGSNSLWSQLGSGAALMNCVVPLDYMLSTFGVLLSLWLTILGFKIAAWVYRHLPKIAGFGTGG
jgi:hypothetical protein